MRIEKITSRYTKGKIDFYDDDDRKEALTVIAFYNNKLNQNMEISEISDSIY